jgi:hypothetical protein
VPEFVRGRGRTPVHGSPLLTRKPQLVESLPATALSSCARAGGATAEPLRLA